MAAASSRRFAFSAWLTWRKVSRAASTTGVSGVIDVSLAPFFS
jgi:hypothetical protein